MGEVTFGRQSLIPDVAPSPVSCLCPREYRGDERVDQVVPFCSDVLVRSAVHDLEYTWMKDGNLLGTLFISAVSTADRRLPMLIELKLWG